MEQTIQPITDLLSNTEFKVYENHVRSCRHVNAATPLSVHLSKKLHMARQSSLILSNLMPNQKCQLLCSIKNVKLWIVRRNFANKIARPREKAASFRYTNSFLFRFYNKVRVTGWKRRIFWVKLFLGPFLNVFVRKFWTNIFCFIFTSIMGYISYIEPQSICVIISTRHKNITQKLI